MPLVKCNDCSAEITQAENVLFQGQCTACATKEVLDISEQHYNTLPSDDYYTKPQPITVYDGLEPPKPQEPDYELKWRPSGKSLKEILAKKKNPS
jgi:hypothetical protein